jgi:hypothetical protein
MGSRIGGSGRACIGPLLVLKPLLRLRWVALNGEWEAFMHYRLQQETARLYPHAERVEQGAWPLPMAA